MQFQLSLSNPSLPRPLSKPFFPIRRTRLKVSATIAPTKGPTVATTMYDLLSVRETAGPEEIKAAYRRQARRWHPDACPSSGDKDFFAQQFMKARRAYEVLSDPVQREDYDFVLFREGSDRGKDRCRFGDWESQLEGLKKRSAGAGATTWGSRMRRVQNYGACD